LLATLGELLCAMAGGSATAVAGARLLAGFGAGVLVASAAASAAALANPDRAFGLVLFCQTLTGAVGLYFAPAILDAVGLSGLFLGLAGLSLSVAAVAPCFLEPQESGAEGGAWRALFGPIALLLLASLFVHYVANNGVWAHLERIGVEAKIAPRTIGAALAIGQAFGLVGSALAMLLAQRMPRLIAIVVGVILSAGAAVLLTFTNGPLLLGAGVALFIGSLSFAVPFFLGALAARDGTGRLVVFGQLAITAGLFTGPAVAAAIVTAASMDTMLWVSTLGFALSLVLAVVGLRRAPDAH
jgi:predicted MFS family arabinose efflux permease